MIGNVTPIYEINIKRKENYKCSYGVESEPLLPVHCTRIKSKNSHIKNIDKLVNTTNIVLK